MSHALLASLTHARGASLVQAWDTTLLNVPARFSSVAPRRGEQGSVLRGNRRRKDKALSYQPSLGGTFIRRLCSPLTSSGSLSCWQRLHPLPLVIDHGGAPAVVAPGAQPVCRLSRSPSHSCCSSFTLLALAVCGWAPSLANTLCGNLFLAGCACISGRGSEGGILLLEGGAFPFQPVLLPGLVVIMAMDGALGGAPC